MSTQTQPSQPKQFFFSSRRRHTRSLCDWSSDVCSSDLSRLIRMPDEWRQLDLHHVYSWAASVIVSRSEERRVGKECRFRRKSNHQKKKSKSVRERGYA